MLKFICYKIQLSKNLKALKIFKYFYGSFLVTALGVAVAMFCYPDDLANVVYSVLILATLEISLSFDNAIINAKILGQMTHIWQKVFIFIGLPIAVLTMRLIFPILLISAFSNTNFSQTISFALHNPGQYQTIVESAMPYICSFGGSFLLIIFLNFFFNTNHQHHWLSILEKNRIIQKVKQYENGYLTAIIIGILLIYFSNENIQGKISIAYFLGIIVHKSINLLFRSSDINYPAIARNGLLGFIYLEIIDASFSFDSVVGAFAISTNIIIIMIGLSIGAMFVRSLTILFVKKKTLTKYIYMEHGAHYAIGFLAFVLLLKIFIHVPEWFSGSVGALIILTSFIHSIINNKVLQKKIS